jgi:hypothetical protein
MDPHDSPSRRKQRRNIERDGDGEVEQLNSGDTINIDGSGAAGGDDDNDNAGGGGRGSPSFRPKGSVMGAIKLWRAKAAKARADQEEASSTMAALKASDEKAMSRAQRRSEEEAVEAHRLKQVFQAQHLMEAQQAEEREIALAAAEKADRMEKSLLRTDSRSKLTKIGAWVGRCRRCEWVH